MTERAATTASSNGVVLGLKRLALVVVCLAVVAGSRLALTCIGYRRVAGLLPLAPDRHIPRSLELRLVRAIRIASRWIPRASCLTQAVALQALLGWRGYASEIRVGVRRDEDGAFAAHAWVVGSERVLIGGDPAELSRFVPLTCLSSADR